MIGVINQGNDNYQTTDPNKLSNNNISSGTESLNNGEQKCENCNRYFQ